MIQLKVMFQKRISEKERNYWDGANSNGRDLGCTVNPRLEGHTITSKMDIYYPE
jgi:hypothetical protein